MWLFDRLSNVLSGLGTEKDKTTYQRHVFAPRDRSQLDAAYRGNAFVRKGIDIVPFDMLRAWRQWQASDDDVEAIEAAEAALGLRTKLMAAMIRGRLYGGGAILIGDGASDPSKELVIDRLPKGGLKYLHVLSRYEITAGEVELDPTSPWFGEPGGYQLNGGRGGFQKIHPSRVVRFLGAPLPDGSRSGHDPWSDSILEAVFDAVDQATSSLQHIAAMLPEAKTDIISIPGLSQLVSTEQGEKLLRDRLRVAMQMRSMFNVTLIDGGRGGKDGGGDAWDQKEIDFGTLPDVARLFLQVVSGAFDIPVTRMLGQSPSGMNATGDSDARNYYDHISAKQNVDLSPTIRPLDRAILRHALGQEPRGVWHTWSPLYQPSDKEKADVGKIKADTVTALVNSGLVPEPVMAEGVKGWLINSDLFPGVEAAYDTHGDVLVDPDEPDLPQLGENGEPTEAYAGTARLLPTRRPVSDAAPRTLYVSRKLKNGADLIAWAKSQGFTDLYPASELHVTVAYSRQPVDWMAAGEIWFGPEVKVEAGGPRLVEPLGDDGLIVLLFASDDLKWRWQKFKDIGASWDHPEYQPHVSFAFSATGADLAKVQPYNGPLVFGPEVFAEIDEGWRARAASDGGGPEGGAPFVDAYNPQQKRVAAGGPGGGRWIGAASLLMGMVSAVAGSSTVGRVSVGRVARPGTIRKLCGIDVKGFSHGVDSQSVRHTFKKHGNPKVEAARGQKAITAADYSEIREITSRPDHVVLGADSGNNGEPRIVFTKRIGADTYTYVGEIRRGKRRIDMVTMWKK